ncbi:MAG TPA: DAHL domain-containing protein [Caulobacteraceae bacterium]
MTAILIERAHQETTTARMIAALDAYERAQADLERDAIKLRGGLLHDYDPLVVDVTQFEAASDRLVALSASSPSLQRQSSVLADAASVQGRLTERLKSDSALMLNSLAYFSRLSAPAPGEPASGPDVAALAAAMLRLTLDASLENQAEVARRIQSVDRHEAVASADPLFNHARLLQRLLPTTDQAVENLLAADAAADRRSLRATLQRDLAAEQSEATIVRVGLLLVSLLLVAVLLDLGRRLRDHVRALARRAELERTLAEISATLIRAQIHPVRPVTVIEGLGRLARGIGADRAYLVGEGFDLRWARPEVQYCAGWPQLALDLAASVSHAQKGSFHVTAAEAPAMLRAAGARSVAAAWATNQEGARVLLGMDALHESLHLEGDEIEVIRLGLDVIAGAFRRWTLEHERAHLERRLEEASRMEAVGAFASGIAHNFNNILAAIGGYAEMAATGVRGEDPPARHLSEILLAVARGRDLIDRILAFGRRSSAPAWREVDVRMALEEAASLLRAAHPDASIEVEAAGAGVVKADPGALQQILLNLGANAIQASGVAAEVTLIASSERILLPRALVAGRVDDGDYVVLAVEDRGLGIAPEQILRIFDPFVTTRADGHGLGLATVSALVRDHGGAIDVISTPGQGSRFEVWLPREPAPGAPPGRLADHGQGEVLLLLCVDELMLADAEDRLAELGYEPIGFSALAAALAAVAAAPERFDGAVVIADGPHAAEWAATLRQAAARLPIIVTSAPGQMARAPGLVGASTLPWPLDARALIHALNVRVI